MMTSSGRVIDFCGTNFDEIYRTTQNQKNNNYQSASSSTSSSTAQARARARISVGSETDSAKKLYDMFVHVVQYAELSFNRQAGPSMKSEIRDAILHGVSDDVLICCIQEAEAAPRPSWGYARAVLRRCLRDGIRTAEDWEQDQARKAARNSGGNFVQREYTAEDFLRGFYVDFDTDKP